MLGLSIALAVPAAAFAETAQTHETETTTTTKKQVKAAKHDADGKTTAVVKGAEPGTAADNTGINKRDRDDRAVTADQQKNSKSDVELTAEIRRAIVDDKELSTNAHNVKIIVQNGRVTLKGPVASKAEKTAVEKRAADVVGAGKGRVTSEIDIAP